VKRPAIVGEAGVLAVLAVLAVSLGCTGPNPAHRTDLPAPGTDARIDSPGLPLDAAEGPPSLVDATPRPEDAIDRDGGLPEAEDAIDRDGGLADAPPDAPPDATADTTADTGSVLTSVDDRVEGTGLNQFTYHGSGWLHCKDCEDPRLYLDSNTWSNVAGDHATVAFRGTRVRFYGVLHPTHGYAGISVDGGAEDRVNCYGAQRTGNYLLWTSDVLPDGLHQLKVRILREKVPASMDYYVAFDRVEIESN
jgi:hypothetical protein